MNRSFLVALLSRRGGIAIQIAIVLVILIGFVALGTEVVAMLMTKRQMQSASDSAALAAATALNRGYPVAFADEATAVTRAAGFVDGTSGTSIAINRPPASGPYAGNSEAVEVIMSQAQSLALIPVVSNAQFTLHVRSVALANGAGVACALALNPTSQKAVFAQGGVTVTMNNCGVAANSTASNAIFVGGGSSISAAALSTPGGYATQGSGSLNISGTKSTGADPIDDPYADRTIPTPGSCSAWPTGSTITVNAGTYCSIPQIKSQTVTLNGVIVLVDSDFTVKTSAISSGANGATVVLTTKTTPSKIGSLNIDSNSTVNITAPTTGATKGMVFFQDPRAPTNGVNSIQTASTSVSFTGALYFPSQELDYQGGTSSSSPCTQLIANTISFLGGVTLNSGCTGTGITPIGMGAPKLVE